MASVSQFAQYLLKASSDNSEIRAPGTLFNFLKHVAEPTLPFSPAILQAFYGRALQFDYLAERVPEPKRHHACGCSRLSQAAAA